MSLLKQGTTTNQENMDKLDLIKELSQANKNNGLFAEIFHRGTMAGTIDFSDVNQAQIIQTFARNICLVNQSIVNLIPKHVKENDVNDKSAPRISPVQTIEFDTGSKSSFIDNTVHNSDVTMDNGIAQEQQTSPWVSEFADEGNDDGYSGLNEPESLNNADKNKKRSFIDLNSNHINASNSNDKARPKYFCDQETDSITTLLELEQYITRSCCHDSTYADDINQPKKTGGKSLSF
jgi:hypothetical protein